MLFTSSLFLANKTEQAHPQSPVNILLKNKYIDDYNIIVLHIQINIQTSYASNDQDVKYEIKQWH